MEKLAAGLSEFRTNLRPKMADLFGKLAKGQHPEALYIGCSDSRVMPSLFAAVAPGDLLVVRNIGNIVTPCGADGKSDKHNSVWAAVEYALVVLKIPHIIVCGHSECGAVKAAITQQIPKGCYHLGEWIDQVGTLESCCEDQLTSGISELNKASQANVIRQIKNLKTSPLVQKALELGDLKVHGWWFDIANADVYGFDLGTESFKNWPT